MCCAISVNGLHVRHRPQREGRQSNALGQVVFGGILKESSANDADVFRAILAEDLDGRLHSIVREDEVLEVRPGDFRTVKWVQSGGTEDYKGWINDLGQVLIPVVFTDDSRGLFVSNRVAVPEPGGRICLLLAATLLFFKTGRLRACPSHVERPPRRGSRGETGERTPHQSWMCCRLRWAMRDTFHTMGD